MFKWFLTGEDKPRIQDDAKIRSMYREMRIKCLSAMIVGYGLYYVLRMTLGIVKKPMLESGFTPTELGYMGAGMMISIAFGKCMNGFIADRCNVKKIVPLGLFASAIINIILGFSTAHWVFIVLWFFAGWFQSMGSSPCIVAMSQWFSKSKLATYVGFYSVAHYLGEGATYLGTVFIVAALGWHAAFYIPGIFCLLFSVLMYNFMFDRPEAYGLPSANEFEGETEQEKKEQQLSTKEAQKAVLLNPFIWILALAAICLGIARYSIISWGVLFFQEYKGYELTTAGMIMSLSPIMGGIGTGLSGIISDKLFRSNHPLTTIIFGFMMLAGIAGMCFFPVAHPIIDCFWISIFGFGLGVCLCFVGGMLAVDLAPRKASGAAVGVIGLCAYFGATLQDIVNGFLIQESEIIVDGVKTYNFDTIMIFWIVSVLIMTLLIIPPLIFRKKHVAAKQA